MIIEDDTSVSEVLALLFKTEGHRPVVAEDGHMALEKIADGTVEPDIVIADYNLPGGMTGLQAIAKLRTALRREVPALILTGDISTDTLRQIANERCVYLNKPTNAEELMRLVGTLLAAERQPGANGRDGTPKARTTNVPSVTPSDDSSSPTVFVVDDDPAQCAMMLELLALNGLRAEAYASSEAFLEANRTSRKGCLVVDAMMQGIGGIGLLERLKDERTDLPAIMITGFGDVPMAVSAMKAGAVDFIEKPVNPEELIASIESALDRTNGSVKWSEQKTAAAKRIANLTPRERSIMDLVLAGHPSKNIAADLGISQRTVENHRASIMKKMGSKSIPALVRLVLAATTRE
jgi:two-component system CheB/CheR fusion protein